MIDYKKALKNYSTPLYIFDYNELERRINYLKTKFPNKKLVYAIKANTFIVREIDSLVDKYEICSPGEFYICRDLNINYDKMVISGVNKDEYFIDELISKYDIGRYTIESLEQYNLLNKVALKYNKKINVLIRLTSGNQFGVSESDFEYILKNYNKEYMNICGIEYFSGTQKHLNKIEKEVLYINEYLDHLSNTYGFKPNEVEYGPGLCIEYYKEDEFDEESYLNDINGLLDQINCKNILIESGRSIAASCGSYLTSVVDLKSNKNGNFVIVDGGINHLVYYGSTLAMKVPPFELLNKSRGKKETYNIYGSLCTINDVLVKNIELNKLKLGDTFIFKKVGAYSITEGISLFLSRDLPKVLIHKDNKFTLVRDVIKTSDMNYPNYEREV